MTDTATQTPTAETLPNIQATKNGVSIDLKYVKGSKLEGENVYYYAVTNPVGPLEDGKPSEVLLPIASYAAFLGEDFAQKVLAQKTKKALKDIYEDSVTQNEGVFDQQVFLATLASFTPVNESLANLKEQQHTLLMAFVTDQIGTDRSKPVSDTNPPISKAEFTKIIKVITAKIDRKSRPATDDSEEAAAS